MGASDYIARHVDLALDALFGELPAIMLTGPRGSGKTTTARRRAASDIDLGVPDLARAFEAAPDAVLGAQTLPVLIDEWQRVPSALAAVKRAVDAHVGPGRYLITGSVRSRLSGAGWPATGRISPVAMYGLTEAELVGAAEFDAVRALIGPADPEPSALANAPDLGEYAERIVRGGFPAGVSLSDRARGAWYEGYVESLIRNDAAELAEVRQPAALAALLAALALNTAGSPTLETLTLAAGADQRTVKAYLGLLEDLRIVERLPAWGVNPLNRLAKAPKYHMVDPGMAAFLAGDDRAGLLRSADRLGRLVDTFVMAQVRPLMRLAAPAVRAYHLRDRNGAHEVDLVLESAAGRIVGIEVKATNTATTTDARHLAWLRDQVGEMFARGIVLHTGSLAFPLAERIWALPLAALWSGEALPRPA
ncbi:MAG: DUF4143 domain-containing protein [Bifidobacteriaceae bacterium]|jgi:predicted AAA+ superfamily ATPase|nr:DUF4143 domain-containing protein [Bifidobacteriaceae bacterium]